MGYVAQATSKNTGEFMTCTKVDTKEEAIKCAKYYRNIGYNARVYSDEEHDKALEDDYNRYISNIKKMQIAFQNFNLD